MIKELISIGMGANLESNAFLGRKEDRINRHARAANT
jgi:hypothetical protein